MRAFKRQASIEGPLGARKSDQTEPISACSLTIGHPAEPTSPVVTVRLRKRILVSHQGRLAASRNRVASQPQPHLRGRRAPRGHIPADLAARLRGSAGSRGWCYRNYRVSSPCPKTARDRPTSKRQALLHNSSKAQAAASTTETSLTSNIASSTASNAAGVNLGRLPIHYHDGESNCHLR